jgi:hypothetical protein
MASDDAGGHRPNGVFAPIRGAALGDKLASIDAPRVTHQIRNQLTRVSARLALAKHQDNAITIPRLA